jgi:hypothetical protein
MPDNVQDHVQLTHFNILELINSTDINTSSAYNLQGMVIFRYDKASFFRKIVQIIFSSSHMRKRRITKGDQFLL